MKHPAWTSGFLALAACLASGTARAAPFCIQNQMMQPQCIYYDPQQCQQEANRQNAECAPNTSTVSLPRAHGDYCVVTSTGVAVCAYADFQTCTTAATRQHGACMQADPRVTAGQPNPFSPANGQ